MSTSGTRTLHFDLVDRAPTAAGSEPPLTLRIGGEAYPLVLHTPSSRAEARRTNAALALMPADSEERITHFVELPDDALPPDRVAHLHVTTPHPDPDVSLPSLLHVSFRVPDGYRARHRERRVASRGRDETDVPFSLRPYGVETLVRADVDVEAVWRDAGDLQTPGEIAKSLVFHHPQLGSIDPYAAAIVIADHLESPQHSGAFEVLWKSILNQGEDKWNTVVTATDAEGKPMTFAFALGDHQPGDPVEIYELTAATHAAMQPFLSAVLRTVSADELLRERSWTDEPGIATIQQPNLQPARVALRNSGVRWTLEDFTPDNGISAVRDTIGMGADRRFSIKVKNHHMRVVGAYAQFYDQGGKVLEEFPWDSNLDTDLHHYESDGKKFLKVVGPRSAIMGIPINAPTSGLSFPFPDDAVAVRLLFGGLGKSGWDSDICIPGTTLTGIFNYAVPTLFLVTTLGMSDTHWLASMVADGGQQTAGMIAGAGVMGEDAAPSGIAILTIFANALGGMLVSVGMQKLSEKITEKLTASAFAAAVPFVGWVVTAANMAATGAALAITTEQVLSSPATLRIDATRSMDLELTLRPDPEHGEAGNPETAIWPAVSDHYEVTVQYKGGTSFVQRGPMPGASTNAPLILEFDDIPAGGWIRIVAGIYAENEWLCGHWESEDVRALPPNGGGPLRVEARIKEVLVPLSADTQYQYKQRIVYDATAGGHIWRTGNQPTGTLAQRSCENPGQNLCELASLSLNGGGFQIGYSWQGSRQGLPLCGLGEDPVTQQVHSFQNLSVLATPESRLRFPNCAFTAPTLVAYDQFLDEAKPDVISQRNFFVDPRTPKPKDPKHLRQLALNTGSPTIDLGGTLPSWGAIPLRTIDALAVHFNGYVIAASWADDKLAIVALPERPVSDAQAPIAELHGGSGKRPGLLRGPRALTVMPDGRILVLESRNRRIQAFDTQGNVVPCFDGEQLATVAASLATDLDAATLSAALRQAFVDRELTAERGEIASSFRATLDAKRVSDELYEALAQEGVRLSRDPANPSDPATNAVVEVVRAGAAWRIVDRPQERAHAIVVRGTTLAVRDELTDVTIEVRAPGEDWVLTDRRSGDAFRLLRDGGTAAQLRVLAFRAVLPLEGAGEGFEFEYLDIAAEAKGYLYVLAHRGDGRAVRDYRLDIYEPNGRFLTRTIGVNAARIAVDLWRNLFALTFDAFGGPGGRTEPTVAQWMPSTPDPS